MKPFDETYVLLKDMVEDDYYPDFLVEKVKDLILPVIYLLETGETDVATVQEKLDEMTCAINHLQAEFEENDSELESVARDTIAETMLYVLEWFGIPIDIEEALREREW